MVFEAHALGTISTCTSYREVCATVRKYPLALSRWMLSYKDSKLVSDWLVTLMLPSNVSTCLVTMCHDDVSRRRAVLPSYEEYIRNILPVNAAPCLFCQDLLDKNLFAGLALNYAHKTVRAKLAKKVCFHIEEYFVLYTLYFILVDMMPNTHDLTKGQTTVNENSGQMSDSAVLSMNQHSRRLLVLVLEVDSYQ